MLRTDAVSLFGIRAWSMTKKRSGREGIPPLFTLGLCISLQRGLMTAPTG